MKITGSLLVYIDWLSCTLPPERITRTTHQSHHTHPIPGGAAVHLHLPLRRSSRPPHQPFKPPCQAKGLSLRLHALPSALCLQYLPPRKASKVQTLQLLRYLRLNVRPSLPLGQQLCRPRQLQILSGFVTLTWSHGDLRRVPLLLDLKPYIQDRAE